MVEKIHKKSIKIPSCTIKYNIIKELAEIIEYVSEEAFMSLKENEKIQDWELDKYKSRFIIEGKELSLVSASFSEMTENKFPKEIYKIKMNSIGVNNKKIEIEFDFKNHKSQYFNSVSISGSDEIWVGGIERKINDILNSCKNYNYIIYNIWIEVFYLPIIGYFSFDLCGTVMANIIYIFIKTLSLESYIMGILSTISISFYIIFINTILGSLVYGYLIKIFLLEKIFPYIEYYNEENIRNKIIKIITVIVTIYSFIITFWGIYSWILSIVK